MTPEIYGLIGLCVIIGAVALFKYGIIQEYSPRKKNGKNNKK